MTAAKEPALAREHRWAIALAAMLTMAVSYVDRQTLAAIAPAVTSALRVSDVAYGWLQSAFSLAYLVGAPLAGRWIDRVGPFRGLLLAVLAWSVVAGAHALAPGLLLLFVLRVALGLAESPSFPGASQTVGRVLLPAERPTGYGVLFTGSSLGAAIAAPLAVALEARWGWRPAFLGSALAGLLWVPLWLAVTRRSDVRQRLGPVGDGASRAANRGAVLATIFHPAVARAVLATMASAPLVGFLLNWTSKLLVTSHRLLQRDLGVYLWLAPVCLDLGSVSFGLLASRGHRRRGHAPPRGLFLAAALLGLVVAAVGLASGPWSATLFGGVAMIGGGGLYALFTADMLGRVPREQGSLAAGITAAAQSLALIVANPLIGAAVRRSGSYSGACVGLALWLIPGCAAWLLWPPPHRTDGD